MSDVWVLLPAHNGRRFIAEQIDSIRAQTFRDWLLLVGDDASSDGTPDYVDRAAGEESRIRLRRNPARLGLRANLNALMEAALQGGARYLFLADQDDHWRSDKMRQQLELMRRLEAQCEHPAPLLVHSDLRVIDESGHELARSFWRQLRVDPASPGAVKSLPAVNMATGNSLLLNRELLEIAWPVPDRALMHDWWLALLAAAAGRIGYLDEPLTDYRRHSNNVLGPRGLGDVLRQAMANPLHRRWLEDFSLTLGQALAAAQRLRAVDSADAQWLRRLEGYGAMATEPRNRRIHSSLELQLAPSGLLRQGIYWLKVMLLPRQSRDAPE